MKATLLTAKELELLRWAVDGADSAHHADPEEFPAVPDFEDLEYRITEQAPEAAETSAERRTITRCATSLMSKLTRESHV